MGDSVGSDVGSMDGKDVGWDVGARVGSTVGLMDGSAVGEELGAMDGTSVGADVGRSDGCIVGCDVGARLGRALGAREGKAVGTPEGVSEGSGEGAGDGFLVKNWINMVSECVVTFTPRRAPTLRAKLACAMPLSTMDSADVLRRRASSMKVLCTLNVVSHLVMPLPSVGPFVVLYSFTW